MTHEEFKERFIPLQHIFYCEAFRMLCDRFEAEDAVQNLYAKLWERKEFLESLNDPRAYCNKILKNICIDRWRAIRAHETEALPTDDAIKDNVPLEIECDETKDLLQHFLAGLPLQQRKVIQMQMQGYKPNEIAEITGLSYNHIRVIISRIRKQFREIYYKQ